MVTYYYHYSSIFYLIELEIAHTGSVSMSVEIFRRAVALPYNAYW